MKNVISVLAGMLVGCTIGFMMSRRNANDEGNDQHMFAINELTSPDSQSLDEIREKITQENS